MVQREDVEFSVEGQSPDDVLTVAATRLTPS